MEGLQWLVSQRQTAIPERRLRAARQLAHIAADECVPHAVAQAGATMANNGDS